MTVQKGGASSFIDQGIDIFYLPVDRIRLGVPTLAPAPTVIGVDGEAPRETPGELRFGAG